MKYINPEDTKKANLDTYSKQKVGIYEHENIFNEANQARIEEVIKNIRTNIQGESALDVGVGSGNVYNIAKKYFSNTFGMDLSLQMAQEKGLKKGTLVNADCEHLPFKNDSFNLITAYAFIHHLIDPTHFFKEAFRCLKPGNKLYVDGDKNLYFFKIYTKIMFAYSLLFNKSQAAYFKNFFKPRADGEIHFGGFYAKSMIKALKRIGFNKVSITYRLTTNPKKEKRIMHKIVKLLHIKYLYSHIVIIATK